MKHHQLATTLAIITLCLFLKPTTALAADPSYKKNLFSLHAGYGNMAWGTSALTTASNSYENKLCSGFTLNLEYDRRLIPQLSLGIVASMYNASGSHAEGKDHVYTTFVGPQLSVYFLPTTPWIVRLSAGLGYLDYKNNSKVFGKDRKVSGDTGAAICGIRLAYTFASHWSIHADAGLLFGDLDSYKVKYHGEKIRVHPKDGDEVKLSRYNLLVGISYHF